MADDSDQGVDLFGAPWVDPKDRRGRKRHRRLPQVAESIAVLRSGGATVEEIAAHMGLSEPTLRKYYFRELSDGAARVKEQLFKRLYQKAMDGSVPAIKAMFDLVERGQAAVPVAKAREASAVEPKLGKKEQAQVDAFSAHKGTSWGDLLQ